MFIFIKEHFEQNKEQKTKEIDKLVYELYGLTEYEVIVVVGK